MLSYVILSYVMLSYVMLSYVMFSYFCDCSDKLFRFIYHIVKLLPEVIECACMSKYSKFIDKLQHPLLHP